MLKTWALHCAPLYFLQLCSYCQYNLIGKIPCPKLESKYCMQIQCLDSVAIYLSFSFLRSFFISPTHFLYSNEPLIQIFSTANRNRKTNNHFHTKRKKNLMQYEFYLSFECVQIFYRFVSFQLSMIRQI